MILDLTALERAVSQLETSLNYSQSQAAQDDEELFVQFRAAAIKAFEYVYELSIKMLRRQLAEIEQPSEVERLSYRDLLRLGAEKGFIDNPADWFQFRENRNMTSHTYDETKAEAIYATLSAFLSKAQIFAKNLKQYNVQG